MIPHKEAILFNISGVLVRILKGLGIYEIQELPDNSLEWEIEGKIYTIIIKEKDNEQI